MRLIDADALKTLLIEVLEHIKENPKMAQDEVHIISGCHMLCEMIDDAPTIEAEPVRHGRWCEIGADKRGRGGIQKCTDCDGTYPYRCNYCPNCGAKMDAKEETA